MSTILKILPEHDELSNPEISRITGIDLNNIPRSRMKLRHKGLIATDNFETIYLTNKGRKLKGQYIKDDVDFPLANKEWSDGKKRYKRSIQRGFFDDAE